MPPAKPVRLGLVGCGRVAEHLYLPALSSLGAVTLVAAADPSAERRALVLARSPHTRLFERAEDLFASELLDGVVIATPPPAHVPVLVQALERSLPALVEKPLAASLEQARALEAFGASALRLVMLGFNRRFWEPVRRLRERLGRVADGAAFEAELVMTSDAGAWSPVSGTPDALDDLATHQLDLLRFLFEREITAISASRQGESAVRLAVRLGPAVVARCLAAHGGASRETVDVRGGGLHHRVRMGSERIGPAWEPARGALDVAGAVVRRLLRRRSTLRDSFALELAHFADVVHRKATPEPGLADGMAALRAVEAARRSLAEKGREVAL